MWDGENIYEKRLCYFVSITIHEVFEMGTSCPNTCYTETETTKVQMYSALQKSKSYDSN